MFAAGGGGYMGGASLPGAPTSGANPLLSNVQNSLAPAPPVAGGVPPPAAAPVTNAPAATLLAQLQAQRDEEERGGGGGGYSVDSRGSYSRGGNVYAGLPGFAAGGGVTTVPQGVGGSLNPTGAAPAIDAGLMGSLASPGAGAAVQTTTTPSANPAANAIQPVQGPQSTAVVTPTGVAPQAQGQVAPQAVAPQAATTPPPATTPPVQPGLDPNVLSRFYDSMVKQAEQQRMRTQTFGNRWQAAGLQAPTAVQLQPGQEMPGEYLPPGMYYDISEALSGLVGGIKSKQLDLAALGEIGDPEQLLNQMTGYQQQQAPFKQALDLRLALAGLGNNLGNPEDLQAQITQLDMSMGPLADALKAKDKLTELGPGRDLTNEFNAVNQWQTEMDRWTVPEGEPYNETFENARLAAQNMLMLAKDALSAGIAHNRAVQEAGDVYNQVFSTLGIPAEQAAQQMGQYAAQRDTLKQGYEAALKAQQYQNQIGYLTGGLDPVAETARIQALIDASKQSYGNVELAGNLNRQIAALAQQGQRLPGFAKGGNWIAGATANSHGQFASKAKKAGMSTKAYASRMSDAPGRTGKQARLAKTLMSFADGGAMTTQEPIIGIGMFSGKPRFQVGEPQYPGGPPMAERLQITPLNRPSALPMGGRMRNAA